MDRDRARVSRMQRSVGITSRLLTDLCPRLGCWLVTLTYDTEGTLREARDWRPRDVSDCMRGYRDWAREQGIPLCYVWVAELQQRGVIHYHVLVWIPKGWKLPKADVAGFWACGMSNTVAVRSAVGYATKYASKLESKGGTFRVLYSGARMHGAGGLELAVRVMRAWMCAPAWLRDELSEREPQAVRRATGGGWVLPETGEYFRSPYAIAGHTQDWSRVVLVRRGVA